jgi:5-(aminomethyl)-3-furanmethanol phosphate kinase
LSAERAIAVALQRGGDHGGEARRGQPATVGGPFGMRSDPNPTHPPPTVVKLGGGLARERGDAALRAWCEAIGRAARRHPLLVVPGGGAFADAVRDADGRFGLRASTSHRMAILAMDQLGLALADLIPGAATCRDLAGLPDGRAAVLLPSALALDATDLPESWEVTSDAIAAWIAVRAGARRLVLVKGVPALHGRDPSAPIRRITPARLTELQRDGRAGGVDGHLATVLRGAALEAWVVGGDDPARLTELLDTGTTTGTRLPADPPARP